MQSLILEFFTGLARNKTNKIFFSCLINESFFYYRYSTPYKVLDIKTTFIIFI